MIKSISYLLVFIFFQTCSAQKKQSTVTMEKFNISEFETHKKAGEYIRVLDDGTVINEFGDAQGYFEKVIPAKGWFYLYKEFYGNGNLKQKGDVFKKGDFQSGIWIKADSNGNKVDEIDYDKPYRLKVESIFEILKQHKIPFTMEDKFNSIRRAVVASHPIWIVEWKVVEGRIERVEIDDATGKITKQDYYELTEDH